MQVVCTDATMAAVETARQTGRSLWRVSSTVFGHIASDQVCGAMKPFDASTVLKSVRDCIVIARVPTKPCVDTGAQAAGAIHDRRCKGTVPRSVSGGICPARTRKHLPQSVSALRVAEPITALFACVARPGSLSRASKLQLRFALYQIQHRPMVVALHMK
jgi:hypothetical protein